MSTEVESKVTVTSKMTVTSVEVKKEIIETSDEKKVIEEEEAAVTAAAAALAAGEKEAVVTKEEKTTKDKESKEVQPPPPRVHKQDFEKDVVYLFQFSRTPVVPSLSPYCLKAETWLRLTGLKYQNVDHKTKFKSSKGQLPFVELNGEEIADSVLIMTKLAQHFGVDPDAQLTNDEKNSSHALISMIENHLCWVYFYWRSKNTDSMIKGFKLSLQHSLGSRLPNGLLNVFFKLTYSRKGMKKVKAHGLGVHSAEEILQFGKQDLKVLEETLGTKQFFFGEKPSNLDVVAFAHLCQIYFVDKSVDYELRDWMSENCPGLVGLVNRMKELCFPDWDKMGVTLGMNTHIPEEKNEEETKEPEKEPLKEEEKKTEVKKEEEK